jgi:flagellar hook assembly protein FlgD
MQNNNSIMDEVTPMEFHLSQNYPNPFKEKTVIKYCVAYKTKVQITVYNSEGKEIEKLVDEEKQPGTYEVDFSTCHSRESGNLPDGYYFYRIEAGDYSSEKKMILIQ